MISSRIKRLGLLAAFLSLGVSALANDRAQQIKIDRAINSPTLAVKYNGVHATLIELRINGVSMGTRTVSSSASSGETTFSINVLSLKDGNNDVEIRLYDKDGQVVGSEKTVITTDSDSKGPVFLSTPKVGENVMGPCEISVGFGRDFKNSYVSFFIDNQFKSMMNFPPYTYTWDTSRETNGWHEVEAWVVDETSATFKTRKVRIFVNNPGGHTPRIDPSAPVSKPVAKTVVKTPAKTTKTTTKLPALPNPAHNLTPAANKVTAATTTEAPIKTIVHATSAVAAAKSTAMAPAAVGLTTTNPVAVKLEGGTAGVKPAEMPVSSSVGPRLMTPTGRRVVAAKAPVETPVKTVAAPIKAVAKVAPSAPNEDGMSPNAVNASVDDGTTAMKAVSQTPDSEASKPVTTSTAPKADPEPDPSKIVALVPAVKTEAPATTLHPLKLDVTGEGMMVKTAGASTEPAKPIVPPEVKPVAVTSVSMTNMGSTDSVVKRAPKLYPNTPSSATKLNKKVIPIVFGTKLPITADYVIEFKGAPVAFDVTPTIHNGVPVTPFRHLIEKSGGEINWLATEHEITAMSDGREIWLKIGDKYAKIDSLAVKLELAPFIQSGRTIVPLSFIRTALNVNVDYDKATGHVLITPKK